MECTDESFTEPAAEALRKLGTRRSTGDLLACLIETEGVAAQLLSPYRIEVRPGLSASALLRRAVELASAQAPSLGHPLIGSEHLLLGLLVNGEGQAAKALEQAGVTFREILERALAMDPECAPAHVTLGLCLGLQGDMKGALEVSLRASELEPARAHPRLNAAHALAILVRRYSASASLRRVTTASDGCLTRARSPHRHRRRPRTVPSPVTVALVTRTVRNIPVEVRIGPEDGMPRPCVVNLDEIHTVPKALLDSRLGSLGEAKMRQVEAALRFALDLKDA